MLPQIDIALAEITKHVDHPKKYYPKQGGEGSFWDDWCQALFLRGVCMRYIAYPVSYSIIPLKSIGCS